MHLNATEVTLTATELHSNIDHSTYEGTEVQGYPVVTISRGEVLVEDGALQVEPGRGRFIERSYGTAGRARGTLEREVLMCLAAAGRPLTAAEVADVVTFLASPRSVAVNGDAIACGGGQPGAIFY